MPSRMVKLKKNLQLLSFDEQISEINFAIDGMLKVSNTFDVKEDTDTKYSAINHLKALRSKIIKDNKGIMTFLYTLFVLIDSMSLNSKQKYNEQNNPKII